MSYIYLASPYSHPDEHVRLARFIAVCREAAIIFKQKRRVFSPIIHCHPIAVQGDLDLGIDFWGDYAAAMMMHATSLHILKLPGWEDSKGVKLEITWANERFEIPVHMYEPVLDHKELS